LIYFIFQITRRIWFRISKRSIR